MDFQIQFSQILKKLPNNVKLCYIFNILVDGDS